MRIERLRISRYSGGVHSLTVDTATHRVYAPENQRMVAPVAFGRILSIHRIAIILRSTSHRNEKQPRHRTFFRWHD